MKENDLLASMIDSKNRSVDVAIVGAGIVGLAHAYMALRKGYKVVLFEREQFAVGASVRNFGLIWPIGQEPGAGLDRAMRSRSHWINVASEAGFWLNQNGSLHVVYHDDELAVLNEFQSLYNDAGYSTELLDATGIHLKSKAVKNEGLKGGLWNATDCTVNPREAIRKIPLWLEEKYGLLLRFGHAVTEVGSSKIKTPHEIWKADKIFICNGADFETLYPALFDEQPIIKCKLQMMKAVSSLSNFQLGPSLCAGLTLRHYAAFSKCPSLEKVDKRYDEENIQFKRDGIHILLSQNAQGELIIGDSHHYGKTMEPFDKEEINKLILRYLHSFTELGEVTVTERWNGIYPKVKGDISLILEPEAGVTIVNGLGGAGMTLSFGLAEEVIGKL